MGYINLRLTYLLTYLLGIKSMAGLRTFMEEWNRYNTFSHPLKFDELLQSSHFSSFL